jgi:hypothetical protein
MTDFEGARVIRCKICGTPFCDREGPVCDCYEKCSFCGRYFVRGEMIVGVDLDGKEYLTCQKCEEGGEEL